MFDNTPGQMFGNIKNSTRESETPAYNTGQNRPVQSQESIQN